MSECRGKEAKCGIMCPFKCILPREHPLPEGSVHWMTPPGNISCPGVGTRAFEEESHNGRDGGYTNIQNNGHHSSMPI